jgi:hypothetical protein
MKFMISGLNPKGEWQTLAPEQQTQRVREHQRAVAKLIAERGAHQRKVLNTSTGLQTALPPITVRNDGGTFITLDGPFVETKEVLGGFDVIEFESRDEAIGYAKGLLNYEEQVYEVREVVDLWWIQHTTPRLAPTFMIAMLEDESLSVKRSASERAALIQQHEAVANEYLARRGAIGDNPVFWAGMRLDWSRNARTMRLEAGQQFFTDGPFAETREVVGGVTLVTCDSIDEALEYARKLSPNKGDIASVTQVESCWWIFHG